MSNKLSPLSNSTSALLELLEFQIWSDMTSHTTLFTCHAQQPARTRLSQSQPAQTMSSPCGVAALDLHQNLPFSCQMICKQHIILNHVFFRYESNLEPITLKCKFPLRRHKPETMCYQSHNLLFTTHVIKFSGLTSLGIPPEVIQSKHNFFMKIKK